MSATEVHSPSLDAAAGTVDMHVEVDIIPVSDVDRAKQFYQRLGWRLDADDAPLDGLRIVQFTPPGSAASVTFGIGLTTAAPGSAEGGLIVSDIQAAHDDLACRGIDAIEAGDTEIVADEVSSQVLAKLSAGVAGLYPQTA